MEFKILTIHNIASIEDATIDFADRPLADADVFLITGNTGSGKSTILDAICLALYGTTPRLANTDMQGDTQEGIAVSLSDPRQMMRRNTGEAFVRLSFVGSNGNEYESEWSVARSYGKIDGRLQSRKWMLKDLTNSNVWNKEAEIKTEIAKAVGLDFTQFCRTTMLAQGQFTRFLNSKDEDKAQILEKITGVDIYSRIGAKVYEMTKSHKDEWEKDKQQAEGIAILNDDQLAELNQKMADLALRLKADGENVGELTTKKQWIDDEASLTKQEATMRKDYEDAKMQAAAPEVTRKRVLGTQWQATIEPRQWMKECEDAKRQEAELDRYFERLRESFMGLLNGAAYDYGQLKEMAAQQQECKKYIEAYQDKAEVYANAGLVRNHLSTIIEKTLGIDKALTEIKKETELVTSNLNPKKDDAQKAYATAQKAKDDADEAVKKAEEILETMNLAELRRSRDRLNDTLQNIKVATERLKGLENARLLVKQEQDNIKKKEHELETDQAQSRQLAPRLEALKKQREEYQATLDKQVDSVNAFAKSMRAKLKVDDICPVCGQKIKSELPHEDELDKILFPMRERLEKTIADLDIVTEQQNKLEAHIEVLLKDIAQRKQSLEADTTVERAAAQLLEVCRLLGMEEIDDAVGQKINLTRSEYQKSLGEVETLLGKGLEQENTLKRLREEKDKCAEALEVSRKTWQNAVDEVSKSMGRMEIARESVKNNEELLESLQKSVAELVGGLSWEIDWRKKPQQFANQLDAEAKRYTAKLDEYQKLENRRVQAEGDVGHIIEGINEVKTLMPAWKELKSSQMSRVENLSPLVRNLLAEVKSSLDKQSAIIEVLAKIKPQIDKFLSTNTDFSAELLKTLDVYTPEAIQQNADFIKKYDDRVLVTKGLWERKLQEAENHRGARPQLEEGDTLESLTERINQLNAEISQNTELLGGYRVTLANDEANRQSQGVLKKKADESKAEYERWDRLNQLIGDATGNKFRKIAQSYVLSSLIRAANKYMHNLTDRYVLKVQPGTFVISVEDAYQGYISRAASTISGGESFLVSLSLALALSDIGSRLSVDTLFIDEGFGTLSGEPLQNAINTLRTLHTQAGRHVGIISHVEELRERIPVQIRVDQEGHNSASRVSVVGM